MSQLFQSAKSLTVFTILLAVLVGMVLITPESALADNPFVTCTGGPTDPCGTCEVVEVANNIIVWLIGFTFMLFTVLFAIAGFKLVTSGGNTSAMSAAKDSLVNALIGLLLILAAWLIVDTLLKAVLRGNAAGEPTGEIAGWGPWAEVKCFYQVVSERYDNPISGTDDPDVAPPAGGAYAPVVTVSGGNIVFNGPDGLPNTADDIAVPASTVTGDDYNLPDGRSLGYRPPQGYIGPDVIAQNPQISPNFRLCDVTNCDESRRRGEYIYIDPFMVAQLEGVRQGLGGSLSVNSGYRSPGYNTGVGGATHSRHQYGDAVDIAVTSSNTEAQISAQCWANGATNVYTYESGRHVHCDWRGARR